MLAFGALFLILGTASASGAKISRGSQFCRIGQDCFDSKPIDAPACSIDAARSGEVCRCDSAEVRCDLPMQTVNSKLVSAYCEQMITYEADESNSFCTKYVVLDKWDDHTRPSDEHDESVDIAWWRCALKPGYRWVDGVCRHHHRYLGEVCWDGGECQNGDLESYENYRLSCAKYGEDTEARCVPSYLPLKREQCECSWWGLNLFVVCSAKDDVCNGHACVLSTGSGKHSCDMNTDNDW
eukprot:TRINITY_DN209_c3_g1_i1.p1 TRINITY_DN209_c3_g1~~TRINITY_DN209_c3_g1_i1.p1  ORF type:complete len:239 (+),score=70.89 TRINITY_DN209_c3_g1_i1:48-764(+)